MVSLIIFTWITLHVINVKTFLELSETLYTPQSEIHSVGLPLNKFQLRDWALEASIQQKILLSNALELLSWVHSNSGFLMIANPLFAEIKVYIIFADSFTQTRYS